MIEKSNEHMSKGKREVGVQKKADQKDGADDGSREAT